ncbi:hypothetical protein [Adhaeretor mobilis]|uniref:Uncharacterized protein n=1 Tax=Adhaeretor mobilis TaxID=1930276 RepID=A0A517MWA9_9BACT|nr:hypothetical protein [Adhaeretor mobilis]QDS99164.1 hypothetical protein HG15A2_24560 [Adhaeretor mobilis]
MERHIHPVESDAIKPQKEYFWLNSVIPNNRQGFPAMYDRQLLEEGLPYHPIEEQSWGNKIANTALADDFDGYIRRELTA